MTVTNAFLQARIAATEAAILAYESAIAAISGGAQSYSMDTGQNRTTVTRANLREIENSLNGALNRLTILEQRRYGSGTIARPGW